MPKIASLQSSFNAGELSPLMYGRTDSPRYKQGLATALNYIPTLQGPLQRRPGFQYMNAVKDSTKPPVLIPFQFSETQSYMLEFGDQYIRFYYDNGQIVTSGTTYKVYLTFAYGDPAGGGGNFAYATRANLNTNPYELIETSSSVSGGSVLELQSPYAWTDVTQLRYSQNSDTLYLFHPNYNIWKLQRFDQQYWTLTQVLLQDGPYLLPNSYENAGDNVNVQMVPTAASITEATITTGPTNVITGAITDPASSGQIQLTLTTAFSNSNFISGSQVYVSGVVGTTEANNGPPAEPASWTIKVTGTYTCLLLGSTFAHTYISGGTMQPALFQADINAAFASTQQPDLQRNVALTISGIRYFGCIVGVENAATFLMTMQNQIIIPETGTAATAWYLGTYSFGNGYPSCGTFHQDRLWLAGCANSPEEVDGSNTGSYENFAPSAPATLEVTDSNALSFQLNSNSLNKLQWLSSNAQGLLASSFSSEWAMTPDSTSAALTPTNFNAIQTSYYGSANAEVIQAGNAAIYIQRAQRKVREMNFFFQVGTFRSTDLTELSEHITLPSITKIVYQKETQPLVWGIRSDGNLVSMIYDRSDVSLQAGWTRHQLGGQSDPAGTNPIIYSMAVIPDPTISFDQLWTVVQRYINGSTVYTIEYMTKIFDDSFLQEDAFQLDCGGTYYAPITISGISIASTCVVTATAHGLSNGQTVKIVDVDGLNISSTDANGNVTITNLVNEKTFIVAGVTTNTFELYSFQNTPISSVGYGAYVSGGFAAKLVTTISGLTWLEGETVGVLADGSWHPDCVVSSGGVITLKYPAAKVQIGYRFLSQGQLLRVEGGAADGTSIGKTRRTTRVAVQAHRIGDLSIGTSFTNLLPTEFSQGDSQQADIMTPLYSGIKRDGVESAYDFESQVCFQQSSPLPGAILSVTSFMEEFDV